MTTLDGAVDTAPARGAHRTGRPTTSAATLAPRRSPAHLLLGAVLMVMCALVFGASALRADERVPVLAVAGPVAAGQVLTAGDVVVARIVPDPNVAVVAETRRGSVVGRTVTVPLTEGSLLSDKVLGPAAWPPAGQSVLAVPVKAGRVPVGLAAGVRVLVVVAPASSAGSTAGSSAGSNSGGSARRVQAPAAVVAVAGGPVTGASSGAVAQHAATTVVSLLMASEDAVKVAGAGGEVALLVQGGGG